ncbi:MAG: Molybdenum cofactor biosynthesis protein MoaD [Magnetococcales bacterium]|nr:Molybdenum cofactor biosynthesis protein MoaD [Magnetococcales bacterium]
MVVQVTFKCFATLRRYLAAHGGKEVSLTLEEGSTPNQVLQRFGVPAGETHLVLVNGVHLDTPQWGQRCLQNGDVLSVWPPIAGG